MLKHLEVFWEIHWPSLQKLIVSNCAHHWTFKTKAQKLTVLLFFQIRQLALRTRFSLSHQGEMYTFRKGPLVSPFLRILNQDVVGWKAGFFFLSTWGKHSVPLFKATGWLVFRGFKFDRH